MAPESNSAIYDEKVDIYSAAVTFYELFEQANFDPEIPFAFAMTPSKGAATPCVRAFTPSSALQRRGSCHRVAIESLWSRLGVVMECERIWRPLVLPPVELSACAILRTVCWLVYVGDLLLCAVATLLKTMGVAEPKSRPDALALIDSFTDTGMAHSPAEGTSCCTLS